ncbi:Uncharacterised protein [Candidatus Bilamarchaeum dharawalense]|uniref:Uncharacterized protein n=1 Tax=Candidatus Bilamarchaeum dharawalense TaxID=2885759 RepID=A0A5E4LMA3_9ARCH|nr:Uncharacterised protein [Candidatus Bilamarchaeum dharawalense]
MGYDIPDEIKYREKIVANLDLKQLGYAVLFILLAFFSYNLPIQGDARFIVPAIIGIIGTGFIFLNLEEKIKDVAAYYMNIRKTPYNSKAGQKFFEVRKIAEDIAFLDDKTFIAVLEIQPINFDLLDEGRKKAMLINYKAFLNQLTTPVQILIRTKPVILDGYFEGIDSRKSEKQKFMANLYADFRIFEENFIDENTIKERFYYIVIPFRPAKANQGIKQLNELVKIIQEKLLDCGLQSKRLNNQELEDLYLSYAESDNEDEEIKIKQNEESKDEFRNILTPSFDIKKDYAIVNGEFHKIVKVTGYPRKVEDGWLGAFLSKNESYDISIHIMPSTIHYMLIYLHNQIIQQTGDLFLSTMKGTPNPSLEIKKADTMQVYNSLYKGEEKMFSVSICVDNKADRLEELDLLTEKCKSNLNAQLMIPKITEWRMTDGIKTALPLAKDKLQSQRDFLTNSLAATFPFISPVETKKEGMLFAHEADTLNPIFIDLDKMSNKHFFVIGISGSGKSYTSKYLIMQQLFKEDTKIYILDPNGEYSALCESLNGHVVVLSRDSESIINIFDLAGEEFGSKLLSLLSAFDIIVGGLTESQKAVLNKALVKAYKKKGILYDNPETWNKQAPTFLDLKIALIELQDEYSQKDKHSQDFSLDAVFNRVEMYCEDGIFAFLDKQSTVDTENNFICFDLSQLPNAIKDLMMFATLELIQREIKKDKKAKVVLIDEGWSLLRSKEVSNYIVEFVKTSRKFNTSIGFITQEIEDLLNSRTGRSILNTASIKILMRQNPTNIDVISKALHLNEEAKNYLLTAQKGFGFLITEQNSYKFFVKASNKIHNLITTNPKDFQVIYKKKKTKNLIQIPKKELEKGLYLEKDLSEEERDYLFSKGYKLTKDRTEQQGGSSHYLVKIRHNESSKHSFLCWTIYYLLKNNFQNVYMLTTSPGDVVVKLKKKRIAFEIETGKNEEREDKTKMKERFERIKKEYDDYYIVVTTKKIRNRYKEYGKVITRNKIKDVIGALPAEEEEGRRN